MQGSGFRVWGLGFRVQGLGFGVQGLRLRAIWRFIGRGYEYVGLLYLETGYGLI